MASDSPAPTRLADYRPPAYWIRRSDLTLDLDARETRVVARHEVVRNADSDAARTLQLDAESLDLKQIAIDDKPLAAGEYMQLNGRIEIKNPPDTFELSIENTISPAANTALSGLYQSRDMLCTQCEAEGFRRITPAIDRPDNLSVWRVTLRADRDAYPQLLCNGNLEAQGELPDNKHFAVWHDPFPKPSYLFAIVAGKLARLEDVFTTCGGREVALHFYAHANDIARCEHAMQALKRAMRWDERVYAREYDLDLFNVVAVADFNMGAMENKSLNIFNAKYVLADKNIASDNDFANIEAVVGHEYFHNWSGNRVTCRDWFQLSLKEGFTVFREQEFSADIGSRGVKRIADVNALREHQFAEDAGPMAHPVRPESYMEINNFYTATVYEKGAEVIRMLRTIVGAENFREGCDLYFSRHDGQAATTDDFVRAIHDAGEFNAEQFQLWYTQAGTPALQIKSDYDARAQTLTLDCKQTCPDTPGQRDKKPFVIPLRAALFDEDGNNMPIDGASEKLFCLDAREQRIVIKQVPRRPLPSLLRGFSAPVALDAPMPPADLAVLAAFDDDPFNRWEAAQQLMLRRILALLEGAVAPPDDLDELIMHVFRRNLRAQDDRALTASLLAPPSEAYLAGRVKPIDPHLIHRARLALIKKIVGDCGEDLLQCHFACARETRGDYDAPQVAARALRDVCLSLLSQGRHADADAIALKQLQNAQCMTDSASALRCIVRGELRDKDEHLEAFYAQWKHEALVVDKWFALQSAESGAQGFARVSKLVQHPAFDEKNPNKVYAVLMSYSRANPLGFHRDDGRGYAFIGEWVKKLDALNPQVAARIASAFRDWRRYTPNLAAQMRAQLEDLQSAPKLSRDVREVVDKSLSLGAE